MSMRTTRITGTAPTPAMARTRTQGCLGCCRLRRCSSCGTPGAPDFDRLFLEGMIKHHEGAIVMVEELFAIDGAGQETEIFQFASHVDSDQRMEIMRMQRMLAQRR
jgi:uncharacterized protein (DUF305 family)